MIRVLLVEDDPMVAELNRLYLSRVPGFQAVAAVGTGPEALALLAREPIDLLLLDIFMPGPSGVDLLSQIRAEGIAVDVIFVTADRDARTIRRALQLGAVDYLIKPFAFERMQQALVHYRETRRRAVEGAQVNQTDLDRMLGRDIPPSPSDALPKGLDRQTLEHVWKALRIRAGFSCEEIAKDTGLSRVTVRKYLEFLCGLEVLAMEPSYGTVGRPLHRYTLRPGREDGLKRFGSRFL